MQKKRLHLYTLDIKYIRDLSKIDDKVMSVSPQVHKENRPFVGIIVILDNKKYCVPITSPKAKHAKMKNDLDFSKMYDKNNNFIGALNFNNMIPVSDEVIMPINLVPSNNDTPKEKKYKELLNNQLDWCNDNADNIIKKANKLYRFVTQTPEKSRNLVRRCCDFKKLETVLEKWLSHSEQKTNASDQLEHCKNVINKTNAILNANPKLKSDFIAAKKEFEQRQATQDKEIKASSNDTVKQNPHSKRTKR